MNGNIFGRLFGRREQEFYTTPDDNRPIRFVPEGKNVWRVVYAD